MPKDQSAELATLVSHSDQAVVAHTFNPRIQEAEEMDLCELKATLGYMRLNLSKRETEFTQKCSQHLRSHTFNPSTRDVEIGSDRTRQREESKEGGDRGI